MKGDTAREAALAVLMACRQNGAWVDGALKAALKRYELNARDAAFASRIAYGVTQNRLWLDHCLGQFMKQKKTDPLLVDILRLGAYQLLFMDKVPDNAAINEAVNMAKGHKLAWAAGLTNAVLRNVARSRAQLENTEFSDPVEALSVRTSHPRPLVERLIALLGAEEAGELLRLDNESVPVTVQTNTLKTTAQELCRSLEAEGCIVLPHPWLADCFELAATGNIENLTAFRAGWFTVQDAAAKLAALAAAPKPGDFVIDTCAAPGGKSFAMAMLMGDKGRIFSCDMEEHKIALIAKNAERLGVKCVESQLKDATVKDLSLTEKADVVLCDVPCSGLGIIRKKPDIRYKDMRELAELPKIQRAILENACGYVRPGGTLVYSTCTVLPEENEGVTDAFLAAHPEFTYDRMELPAPYGAVEGHITFWPQRDGTDGFYICRMKRG